MKSYLSVLFLAASAAVLVQGHGHGSGGHGSGGHASGKGTGKGGTSASDGGKTFSNAKGGSKGSSNEGIAVLDTEGDTAKGGRAGADDKDDYTASGEHALGPALCINPTGVQCNDYITCGKGCGDNWYCYYKNPADKAAGKMGYCGIGDAPGSTSAAIARQNHINIAGMTAALALTVVGPLLAKTIGARDEPSEAGADEEQPKKRAVLKVF